MSLTSSGAITTDIPVSTISLLESCELEGQLGQSQTKYNCLDDGTATWRVTGSHGPISLGPNIVPKERTSYSKLMDALGLNSEAKNTLKLVSIMEMYGLKEADTSKSPESPGSKVAADPRKTSSSRGPFCWQAGSSPTRLRVDFERSCSHFVPIQLTSWSLENQHQHSFTLS